MESNWPMSITYIIYRDFPKFARSAENHSHHPETNTGVTICTVSKEIRTRLTYHPTIPVGSVIYRRQMVAMVKFHQFMTPGSLISPRSAKDQQIMLASPQP